MSAGTGIEPRQAAAPEPPLEWTVNPWRVNRGASVLGVILAAAFVYGAWGFDLPRLTFLALVLAFSLSLGTGFLPTRFRVDERGVGRRTGPLWHRREWSAIRRAVVRTAPPLVWLSTEARPGPLDAFRGIALSVPSNLPDHGPLLLEIRRRLALHGL